MHRTRPVTAYLGLGSNVGDRFGHLSDAVRSLGAHPGVVVCAASSVYETEAHTLKPDDDQPPYLNAVLHVETTLGAEALLDAALRAEALAGRTRRRRWAPRTLDVDVLLYDGLTISTERLHVPHPHMGRRRFVLVPLAELAPDLYVPDPYGATVTALLQRCSDATTPAQTDLRLPDVEQAHVEP